MAPRYTKRHVEVIEGVPFKDQRCLRHKGPRSFCGCGLPLAAESQAAVLIEQRADEDRVLAEGNEKHHVDVHVFSGPDTIGAAVNAARMFEERGRRTRLEWHRDDEHLIDAMVLYVEAA